MVSPNSFSSSGGDRAAPEARELFLLLGRSPRVFRSSRVGWFLSRLSTRVALDASAGAAEDDVDGAGAGAGATRDIIPVSYLARDPISAAAEESYNSPRVVLLTSRTRLTFLSQQYSFVYVLDLSPSVANVSSSTGSASAAAGLFALRSSLREMCAPFYVPGSALLLTPKIHVTVLVWSPFVAKDSQAVLCQGWQVSSDNIDALMAAVSARLQPLREGIANANRKLQAEITQMRADAERMMGGLFDVVSPPTLASPSVPISVSDIGFQYLVRTALLALQLLPDTSNAGGGVVVLTDGCISSRDVDSTDALLSQLRARDVTLSFVDIGSGSASPHHQHHPSRRGLGRTVNRAFMEYFAGCCHGTVDDRRNRGEVSSSPPGTMNWTHRNLLCWTFHTRSPPVAGAGALKTNRHLVNRPDAGKLRRKYEAVVDNCSLRSVVACRIREGFTITQVALLKDHLEVKLTMAWKPGSYLHYVVQSLWPEPPQGSDSSECKVSVYVQGNYDSMHDLCCRQGGRMLQQQQQQSSRRAMLSAERARAVRKFQWWLGHLARVDRLLVHVDSFRQQAIATAEEEAGGGGGAAGGGGGGAQVSSPAGASEEFALTPGPAARVPDGIARGVALFYYNTGSEDDLCHSEVSPASFAGFWRPICSLDSAIWHRWMHTHRISLFLNHDYPLPKNLVCPNSSGRFTPIQSRKASIKLFHALKEFSTFTLLENCAYIRFIETDSLNVHKEEYESSVGSSGTTTPDRQVEPEEQGGDGGGGGGGPVPTGSQHASPLVTSFYMIRVVTLPPTAIVWLAFPAGVSGATRNQEFLRMNNLLSKVDLVTGTSGIGGKKDEEEVSGNNEGEGGVGDRGGEEKEGGFVPACKIVQKPFEKIMIRYDRVPLDFEDLLSPITSRIHPNPQDRLTEEEAAVILNAGVGPYITLSRFLDCKRWIWDLDEDGGLSEAAGTSCSSSSSSPFVPRLLLLLIQRRIADGFMFAYSNNGVQSLYKEFRMIGQETEDASPQTMLVQFVVFPPTQHALAPGDEGDQENEESEEGEGGAVDEADPGGEAKGGRRSASSSTKIVTEMWTEPHNGLVLVAGNEQEEEEEDGGGRYEGLNFQEVPQVLFDEDREVIKTLSTLENVRLLCQDDKMEVPAMPSPRRGRPHDVYRSGLHSVLRVPFRYDLVGLLARCDRTELLLSTFVQEFSFPAVTGHDQNDKPNDRLCEAFQSELAKLYDRELALSVDDSRALTDLVSSSRSSSSSFSSSSMLIERLLRNRGEDGGVDGRKTVRWRCFARCTSRGEFAFVVLPASFQELRSWENFQEASRGELEPSSSSASSASSSSDNLLLLSPVSSPMPPAPLQTAFREEEASLQTRPTTAPGVATGPGGIFKSRKRTQSIDNSDASERRGRRNSVSSGSGPGAAGGGGGPDGGGGGAAGGGAPAGGEADRPQLRPRTHTFSYIHRGASGAIALGGRGRGARRDLEPGKEQIKSVSRKTSAGSMSLPVLVFECKGSRLERSFKVASSGPPKSRVNSESVVGSFDLRLREDRSKARSSAEEEEDLLLDAPQSVTDLYGAFNKSRVSVLFYCLQQGLRVHELDVQRAIDGCENEIASPVQMEKLLESICAHVGPGGGDETGGSGSCSGSVDAHKYIKKKFSDLVRQSFEPVPCLKKFFFFRTDKMSANLSSSAGIREISSFRHRRDTKDTNTSSLAGGSSDDNVVVEFKAEDLNMRPLPPAAATDPVASNRYVGSQNPSGYATPLPTTTADHGSMSFFSHLGSETSGSSFSIDNLDDSDAPLFLQITASVKCGDRLHDPVPLSNIPTCLEDLFRECGLRRDIVKEDSISVFLDLVYITFPTSSGGSRDASTPLPSADRDDEMEGPSDEPMEISRPDGIEQLPDQQRHALLKLREDVEWAIEDEIVFALTRSPVITVELLEKVAGHISAFPNRPGCTIQLIPLTFVMAQDVSFEIFRGHLEGLKVDGFKIVRCGEEYRYLVVSSEDDGGESEHPRYWLLFKTQSSQVRVFFHYREGQFTNVLPWRQALKSLAGQVKEHIRSTNQQMLLRDLHETRVCNRLLEAEVDDDVWIDAGRADDDEDDGPLEANLHFGQGHFSCSEVWSSQFTLHPRLSIGAADSKSIGVDTFKDTLLPFAVVNRDNMYVYMDDRGEVFYMKVQEELNRSRNAGEGDDVRSRTSSCSSYATESSRFHHGGPAAVTSRPSDSSSPSVSSANISQHKSKDVIVLQVFGVKEPSPKFKEELIAVLQRKLDEVTVDKISVALQRNPRMRLTSDDVHFLQGQDSLPTSTFSLEVSQSLLPWMNTLLSYFLQDLLEGLLIRAKFTQVGQGSKRSPRGRIFLYNQVKTRGGHRGIACMEISSAGMKERRDLQVTDLFAVDADELFEVVKVDSDPAEDTEDLERCSVRFSLWERGRVDLEHLTATLTEFLRGSAWELRAEFLLNAPLVRRDVGREYHFVAAAGDVRRVPSRFKRMAAEQQLVQDGWLVRGLELGVPSLSRAELPMSSECDLELLLAQLRSLAERAFFPLSVSSFARSLSGEYVEIDGRVQKVLKGISRKEFLLVVDFSSQEEGEAFLNLKAKRDSESSRRDSEKQGGGGEEKGIMPRKCHLSLLVSALTSSLTWYNVAKEAVEPFKKEWSAAVSWANARGNLSADLVSQKLGLFQHQISTRTASKTRETSLLLPPSSTSAVFNLLVDHESFPGEKELARATRPREGPPSSRPPSDTSILLSLRDLHPFAPAGPGLLGEEDLRRLSFHAGHLRQALEASLIDRKMSRVFNLWIKRGGDILRDQGLEFVKKHSRLLHFCLTPLLFLPEWRVRAFATRAEFAYVDSSPPKDMERTKEEWVCQLTECFTQEYQQYVQTLGFVLTKKSSPDKGGCVSNKTYLQKVVLGGILLFEIGISEPFFYSRLFAVEEIDRRGPASSESSARASLVGEADRVKYLMHMHSFTYDFHVRTAKAFLESRWEALSHLPLLRPGYDIKGMLEDFLKYYSKAPNFARNRICFGRVTFPLRSGEDEEEEEEGPGLTHRTLLENLLLRSEEHGFRVIHLEASEGRRTWEHNSALIQIKRLGRDDRSSRYDCASVVFYDQERSGEKALSLKYFVLLVSRKDQYPTFEDDGSLGIFQPVVSKAIDDDDKKSGAAPATATNEEEQEEQEVAAQTCGRLHSEAVFYVGYYSTHELTVDEEAAGREGHVRQALQETMEKTALRCKRDMLWESLLRHPWGDDSVAATFAAASVFPEARLRKLLSMVRHEERPELGRMLALAGRAAAAKTAPAGGGGGGSAGGGKRGGGGGIGSSAASVSDVVKKFVTKFGQRRCNTFRLSNGDACLSVLDGTANLVAFLFTFPRQQQQQQQQQKGGEQQQQQECHVEIGATLLQNASSTNLDSVVEKLTREVYSLAQYQLWLNYF